MDNFNIEIEGDTEGIKAFEGKTNQFASQSDGQPAGQPEGIEPGLWQNLLDIGLTASEAKVYFALVNYGSLTAVDACKLSGVPRAKIYEILINLSAYGLCYETSGKKKKYTAVNPKEGLQRKMETERRDLDAKEKLAFATGEKLLPLFKSLETAPSLVTTKIHFLSNADLTAKVYLRLLQDARQEIVFLSKAPYNISVKASQSYVHAALDRGVRVKSIFEITECQNKDGLAAILENQAKGVEVGVLPSLPSKLIIGDQDRALLILNEVAKEDFDPFKESVTGGFSGIFIEHFSTVALLRIAFDSLWQQAMLLETALNEINQSASRS